MPSRQSGADELLLEWKRNLGREVRGGGVSRSVIVACETLRAC